MNSRFVFFVSVLVVGSVLHEDTESSPTLKPIARGSADKVSHLYVDKSVFNQDGTARIDLSNAARIALVDSRMPSKTDKLQRLVVAGHPSVFAARAKGCCLLSVPGVSPSGLLSHLRANSMRADTVAVGSLVDGTNHRSVGLGAPPISVSSLAEARTLVRNNRGNTVILLGRLDDEKLVGRRTDGGRRFAYSVADLHRYAKRHDVQLIVMGLAEDSSAQSVPAPFAHVGGAAHWLNQAVAQSKDLADFFGRMVGPGLQAVAAARALAGSDDGPSVLEVRILSRPQKVNEARVQVAAAYLLGRSADAAGQPSSGWQRSSRSI